ncbi:hypothetical protein RB619_05505 [Flavobacterium sp. LHD-80]|uniref:hypothetical protein n=1 Tax=Flavobacterium sp. LHD-80 TaxID=3071411 RepID=UPI0027DEB61D|nr:hypothetical protein [Flavobacterium sp. LHD-80]MDQ6470093.1 hypothetical protein [Flavobacterium sp. LHD-80]
MKNQILNLTEDEQDEVVKRYYNNEPISNIIDDFNLDLHPKQLFMNLPPEVLNESCGMCGEVLIRKRLPRNNANAIGDYRKYCSKCKHTEERFCYCQHCRRKEEIEDWDEESLNNPEMTDVWLQQNKKKRINIHSLSLKDEIYLAVMLIKYSFKNSNYRRPLIVFTDAFAPTDKFSLKIIDRLYKRNIIAIYHRAEDEFPEIKDYNRSNFAYSTRNIYWSVNVESDFYNSSEMINRLLNPKELCEKDYLKMLQLWKRIALHELIEYYNFNAQKFFKMNNKIKKKTKKELFKMLDCYSVAEIYSIINKATNSTLRHQAVKKTSKNDVSKKINQEIQSIGKKVKVKNLKFKKHIRNKECPESTLSKFFFEKVIKIGDAGFYERPSIDWIKK